MIKILFVKDLSSDVDLAVSELRKEALRFEHKSVNTSDELVRVLTVFKPDLVISDYNLAALNGLETLKMVKKFDPEIPFIICTKSVNEETAVECLKAGAVDYVLQEHIKRLPFSVKEALKQVDNRKEINASEMLLKDSQDRLSSILKTAPVGIGLVIDRVIVEVNDTLCKMIGYTKDELTGKSSEILYPSKEEYEFVGKVKYRDISENNIGIVETKFKCKSGKIINVILSSTPLDKNDYSRGVTFTVSDISSLSEVESELNNSYRSIKTLIGNLQGMVYRCKNDKKWTMEFLSDGARELTGYSPDELLYNSVTSYNDLIHEDDRKSIWDQVQKAIKDRKHFQYVYRIVTKSGEIRKVWEKGEGIFSPDGKLEFLEGFITDVTQRENVKEALRESKQLFETLAKASPVGIFRTQENGYTSYVNPKWMELSGLTEEEATGLKWLRAVHPDDRKKLKERWRSAFKSHESSNAEYRFQRPDGTVVWVIGNAVPEMNGDKIVGYVGTITDITERKETEKALQESEDKFRSIAENLTDVIFLTDEEGVIKYISPSSRILGYTPEECVGRFFGQFLSEGELEKAMGYFSNALNSKNTNQSIILYFKKKDGNIFAAELSGSLFKTGDEPVGVLGLFRDVSDKMKQDVELRKLSRAVEQSPASIIITDTRGLIEYANPRLCEITGYTKEELLGKNPSVFNSGEKSGEEYRILWDTIKSGNDWKGEFHNKKKNGSLYWESASISPITNDAGIITHYVGIKEDITDKKLMENAVIASEQRYRELFINNPVPTYIFDVDTLEFVEVNDATVKNYGFSRKEFGSITLKDIRIEDDIPELLESIKGMGKSVYYSNNSRHRRKDGVVFPVEITSHPLPEKKGRRTRLVMSIDITERVKAAEQMRLAMEKAEASDNLKTTFLNNISHEVRTPLNGILGFAELLSQTDLSDEDKRESVAMLKESSDRLLNAITSYMDISLLTSGNMSVHIKEFSPGKILRNIYRDYSGHCLNKKLELFMALPDHSDNLLLQTDQELLNKIVSHLLNNAIKFTEKGTIHFGYNIHETELEFFVKDSGIGINKDLTDSIFDRFVKVESGTTNLTEGSGLGLSIVKGMLDLLGGKIRVSSEVGNGTSMFFTIPLIDSFKTAVTDTVSKGKSNRGVPGLILVAEDDETNFFYLNAILSRETNATIIHANNGKEAVELFEANPGIQLVLMDIKMPVMDGFEATRQIKLINKDVPVIAITAYAMMGDKERVLAAGCDEYMSKPISKKLLLQKVSELIDL